MAFTRLNKNLPQDPQYTANLQELGYALDSKGQFVKLGSDDEHFNFFHTDSDRANELRKEAMHECARQVVLSSLDKMGVKQLFCHDGTFSEEKPGGPAIPILTTQLAELKAKKDVIVIVGEHMQDLGIWAYRSLMREGGVDGGSAVGLVKKLQDWGKQKTAQKSPPAGLDVAKAIEGLSLADDGSNGPGEVGNEDVPGVIILNCGQRLWSPKEKKIMTVATWLARSKQTALDDHIRVDPEHNHVPGHKEPGDHVATVFEAVIPNIIHDSARVYLVGISEGAENMLHYLDQQYGGDSKVPLFNQIQAFAFMQPTHDALSITYQDFEDHLNKRGRSWITAELKKGTLLNVPNMRSQNLLADDDSVASSPNSTFRNKRHGSRSSISQPISIPGTSGKSDAVHVIEKDMNSVSPQHLSNASSYVLPKSGHTPRTSLSAIEENLRSNGSDAVSDSGTPADLSTLKMSGCSLESDGGVALNQSQSTSSPTHSEAGSLDSMPPNPYASEEINTATFSGGVMDVELLWPAVMDDVLDHFRGVQKIMVQNMDV